MTFYKTSHPGSNSFSQVDYIFTTAKSLSTAVFIIYFMLTLWNNLNTANVRTIDRLSVLFWTFLNFFASAVSRCTSQN